MKRTTWDVLVVGSGPGGSIAAKTCAGAGLKTLLVEKKNLPRDKVCSGMVMGSWAKNLIREHFGEIPKEVLIEQGHYKGIALHIGTKNTVEIPSLIPVGWRKDLDYWMCQKAAEAGAQVKDEVRVQNIMQEARGYEVEVREGKGSSKIYANYIIGADGALSSVRKCIYPELKVRYRPAYRECYDVQLSLEKEQFHWFFPWPSVSPRFDINYKGRHLLIEGGSIRAFKEKIKEILAPFGLHPDAKPLWRDGCVIPVLHEHFLQNWSVPENDNGSLQGDFLRGSFSPARGNALLVGDAAGFLLPFTHEGIGSALKSGFLAAESVLGALTGNGRVDKLYLRKTEGMKKFVEELLLRLREMEDVAKNGAGALCDAMAAFIERTLHVE